MDNRQKEIRDKFSTGSFQYENPSINKDGKPIGKQCGDEMEMIEENLEEGYRVWRCPNYYQCQAVTFINQIKKPQARVNRDGEIEYNN